jgi:hypothetical protein
MPSDGRLRWAGALSLAAGAVHGGVAPEHFAEWWGYGLFFVVAATAQAVLGLALLTDAVNPRDSGPGWRRLQRAMLWAGVVGNLLILALYTVTRTVGIPFLGPGAGTIEEIGLPDVASLAFEVATVALLALALRRPREAAATA